MEELNLQKHKFYELAFISTKEISSKATEYDKHYIASEHSKATEFGFRIVHCFESIVSEHADIETNRIYLLEWPSKEVFDKFQSSIDWKNIWHNPDSPLQELNTVYFLVDDDADVVLEANELYEFAGFWMNKKNVHLMPEYFKKMSTVVQRARPQSLVTLNIAKTNLPFDLKPDRFNLLRWDGGAVAREQMFSSEAFKKAGYLRALALDRILTILIHS